MLQVFSDGDTHSYSTHAQDNRFLSPVLSSAEHAWLKAGFLSLVVVTDLVASVHCSYVVSTSLLSRASNLLNLVISISV